jgi:ferritin-like metal-binding protein YciE
MKPMSTEASSPAKKQGAAQVQNTNGRKPVGGKEKVSKTLNELFVEELRNIYSAELQLLEALPEMAKAAYSEDLQDAFEFHHQQTKRQVERIEKIADRLRMSKMEESTCKAMQWLIAECVQVIERFEESPVRDSALIIGAQKIEHYEIASYGSLRELADVLGYAKIAELLDRTLEEEETIDKNLSLIAQDINDDAYELEHEKVY